MSVFRALVSIFLIKKLFFFRIDIIEKLKYHRRLIQYLNFRDIIEKLRKYHRKLIQYLNFRDIMEKLKYHRKDLEVSHKKHNLFQ